MADNYIALLRAINLAGLNRVPMAKLRAMLEALGMKNVTTLLQSGNVVFSTNKATTESLEKKLEAASAKTFGFATDYFVRTDKEWQKVIDGNPFPREAAADPGRLIVLFLKGPLKPASDKALQDKIPGREVIKVDRVGDRHAYIYYPDGQGRSKLTAAMLEKYLGSRGTARNWNTVLKLSTRSGE